MFFQVLFLSSSAYRLDVLFGNLLHHLSILVSCLDPGHGTSVKVQDIVGIWLVYDPTSIPRQLNILPL